MNNPFRDAFPVEVRHFLMQDEVLQQQRTPGTHTLGVFIIVIRYPGSSG